MKDSGYRWVVLGAGGFIGTNLCRRLAQEGAQVVAFGRRANFPDALEGCTWLEGDFFNEVDLTAALQGAQFVVHALSTVTPAKSNEVPIVDIEENLIGTLRLINACIIQGVARLIVLSSGGTIYGANVPVPTPEDATTDPLCSYGIVKLAVEKYLAIYRRQGLLDSIVLRVANPFGPYQVAKGQGVIAATLQRFLTGQAAEIWGDGTVTRDYVYIDDVVDAIIASAELVNENAPRLYNIGSGLGRSLNEVIADITELHGAVDVVRKPGRTVDVPVSILDIQRARRFLAWQPRTEWRDGLFSTYQWFQNTKSRL